MCYAYFACYTLKMVYKYIKYKVVTNKNRSQGYGTNLTSFT